ncbi:13762_t:CDS:1, partial [Cetraspora pellucida]
IEDDDLYTFELKQIITEIENEITINDPTDDDTEEEFEDKTNEESEYEVDESENKTTN